MGAEQLKRLFFIICKYYANDLVFGPAYDDQEIKSDLKVFKSVFPKRLKSVLEPAVMTMARVWPQFDFENYRKAFQMGQYRMALLATGEWEGLVQVICREEGLEDDLKGSSKSGLSRLGIFSHSETLKSLVRFSSQEEFFAMRRKIGKGLPKFALGALMSLKPR